MGFVIIEGRSGGYPCIPQLPELDSSFAMRAPYPKGYPVAASGQIPKLLPLSHFMCKVPISST